MAASYELLREQTENNIYSALVIVEDGYNVLAKAVRHQVKGEFLPFLQAYKDSGSNPQNINLTDLNKTVSERLDAETDLYIIDRQGIIAYSTYKKDIGLDFKNYPDFYEQITRIREGNEVSIDKITKEVNTGDLRVFAYMPTPDHNYLLEIGVKFDKFKEFVKDIDISKMTERLKVLNPDLEAVYIQDFDSNVAGVSQDKIQDLKRNISQKNSTTANLSYEVFRNNGGLTIRYLLISANTQEYASDGSRVVKLIYNSESINKALRKMMLTDISVSLFLIVIAIILTVIFSDKFTRPILEVARGVYQISQGDFGVTLKIDNKDEIGYLAKEFNNMSQKVAITTETFQKFVPQQFLNRVAKEGIESIAIGNVDMDYVAILFSDIRSFTDIAEKMKPQDIFEFLNVYLSYMETPIQNNRGFVDKFIGDAIMAIFDDGDVQNKAQSSIYAAIGMQQALSHYNQNRVKEIYPLVHVGIGIHAGEAMIGTIGSSNRMDSTAIGDTVNIASRLEGLTKQYNASIIISDDTYQELGEKKKSFMCRELDYVTVKGKEKPIYIFEVCDSEPSEIRDKKQLIEPYFQQARQLYHKKQWLDSIDLFEKCLSLYPDDKPSQIYIIRCKNYIDNPPSKNWNGVFNLHLK